MRQILAALTLLVMGCMPSTMYTGNVYPEKNNEQQFNEDVYRCQMQATAQQQAAFPVIDVYNMGSAMNLYDGVLSLCLYNFGWRQSK